MNLEFEKIATKAVEKGEKEYAKFHKNNYGRNGHKSKQQCIIDAFADLLIRVVNKLPLECEKHVCWCEKEGEARGSTHPPCKEIVHNSPRKCVNCGTLL